MPFCGAKQPKKQKRSPSPSYGERDHVNEVHLQLKKEADDQREKANKLNLDLDLIRQDRNKLRSEAEGLRVKVTDLKEDLVAAKAKLREADDKHRNVDDLVQKHEDKLKEIGREVEAEKNQRESTEKDKRKIDEELKDVKKHLETERSQRMTAEDDKSRSQKENKNIERELTVTKETLEVAQKEMSSAKSVSKLTQDLQAKIDELQVERQMEKELRQQAQDDVNRSQKEKEHIERELTVTKETLEVAQKEMSSAKSVSKLTQDLQAKIDELQVERQMEKELRQQTQHDVNRLASDNESMKLELDLTKTANHESMSDLKRNLENATVSHRHEVGQLRATITDFERSSKEETEMRDKLLTRLSAVTASALMDGNPNVSDLSDPNRPEKLREQMSECYDNQWTDASEELEKLGKSETDIISMLSTLLMDIYNHCKESSEDQLARVEEDMFLPPMMESPPSPGTNGTEPVKSPTKPHSASKIPRFGSSRGRPALVPPTEKKDQGDGNEPPKEAKAKRSRTFPRVKGETVIEIPQEIRKGIKEYRKQVAKQVIPVVEKEVTNKLRSKPEIGDQVVDMCKEYISKCVRLCWYMCVQDPALSLSWDTPSDNKFDSDSFRAFTKNGSHIEYVVWPTMRLHEGGPIMGKGIAQGINL